MRQIGRPGRLLCGREKSVAELSGREDVKAWTAIPKCGFLPIAYCCWRTGKELRQHAANSSHLRIVGAFGCRVFDGERPRICCVLASFAG